MEAGKYEQALAFWSEQHEQYPENLDVLRNLVSVTSQSGDHDAAVKWARKRVDIAEDDTAKTSAYAKLAGLQLSRLREADLTGRERLRAADIGIGALQSAAKIQPDRIAIARDLAQLYHQRATAHGASWARNVDLASERILWQRVNELQKKKKQEQKQAADEAAAESGAGDDEASADDADESDG